ncbi:MAG: hypothetical protein ACXVJD_16370 [Mucilaginibacter sp.]
MKTSSLYYCVLISCLAFVACQQGQEKKLKAEPPDLIVHDSRPKSEIAFLKRVDAEYDFNESSTTVSKDAHMSAFNSYAKDSLKNFTDWEFIVTDVNSDPLKASSFASYFLDPDNNPCYNLWLAEPIRIDKTIDTISIQNKVEFIYTILKKALNDDQKKQLITIRTLEAGDTIIASGALTHIDGERKVNFAPLFDDQRPWTMDALLTKIHIKPH